CSHVRYAGPGVDILAAAITNGFTAVENANKLLEFGDLLQKWSSVMPGAKLMLEVGKSNEAEVLKHVENLREKIAHEVDNKNTISVLGISQMRQEGPEKYRWAKEQAREYLGYLLEARNIPPEAVDVDKKTNLFVDYQAGKLHLGFFDQGRFNIVSKLDLAFVLLTCSSQLGRTLNLIHRLGARADPKGREDYSQVEEGFQGEDEPEQAFKVQSREAIKQRKPVTLKDVEADQIDIYLQE
ncbi:unnamed protein product, partial [Symbiodinium sp. KB8]